MNFYLLSLLFVTTNAFTLNTNNGWIPIFSKLESIITSKAIGTSFYSNLRNEMTMDKMFTEITNFSYHHNVNYAYISIFLTYLYGEYKYIKGVKINNNKLKKIDRYDKIYRNAKEIIYIFLFIFTKDIQHVM
jgi:hypothetical protein